MFGTTATTFTVAVAPGHTYGFYTIATDNVGYKEDAPAVPDTVIQVGSSNRPPTLGNATFSLPENSPNGTVVGTVTGSDPDGDPLTYSITAGNTGGAFAINPTTGQIMVSNAAALDYETNPTFALTVRVSDGSLTADATVTVNLTNVLEVTGFDVQHNQTQRSFVRYADVTFADATTDIQALLTADRVRLTRYNLDGTGGTAVALSGVLSVAGHNLSLDFGSGGLGGSPNTTTGDGYYTLGIDLDGDGTFETSRSFYRILGDVDGNRKVEVADANLIPPAYGTANPERDVNGDGVVNATDRTLALRSVGRQLADGLHIDD